VAVVVCDGDCPLEMECPSRAALAAVRVLTLPALACHGEAWMARALRSLERGPRLQLAGPRRQ
jgi:hypothetical protein